MQLLSGALAFPLILENDWCVVEQVFLAFTAILVNVVGFFLEATSDR